MRYGGRPMFGQRLIPGRNQGFVSPESTAYNRRPEVAAEAAAGGSTARDAFIRDVVKG
jgi:hypothetical protein